MLLLGWCSCRLVYLIMTHWLFFSTPWLDGEVLWIEMIANKTPRVDIRGVVLPRDSEEVRNSKSFYTAARISSSPLSHTLYTMLCIYARAYIHMDLYIQAHTGTHVILLLLTLLGTLSMCQKSNFLGMLFIAKNKNRPQYQCQNPIVSDKVLHPWRVYYLISNSLILKITDITE